MMARQTRELNNGPKIQKEKETVTKMIEVYCRRNHHHRELCEECQDLKNYAMKRLSFCQFGEEKSFCSYCPVHCYKPGLSSKNKSSDALFWSMDAIISSSTCR